MYVRVDGYIAFAPPPRFMYTTENYTLCISHLYNYNYFTLTIYNYAAIT